MNMSDVDNEDEFWDFDDGKLSAAAVLREWKILILSEFDPFDFSDDEDFD
jgi:hypothetical protein